MCFLEIRPFVGVFHRCKRFSRIREIKHPVITISPCLDLDDAQYKQVRCDCIARLEEIITSVTNNCRTEHEVDPASSALVT